MTRFLVLIYGDEQEWAAASDEWQAENGRRHRAFLDAAGKAVLTGSDVLPSVQAVLIRGNGNGGQSVSEGPFVSTPVGIGGFYVIEANDLDHAIELARGIPEASAPSSGVEVRAFA
jgi:hypothetical protein